MKTILLTSRLAADADDRAAHQAFTIESIADEVKRQIVDGVCCVDPEVDSVEALEREPWPPPGATSSMNRGRFQRSYCSASM